MWSSPMKNFFAKFMSKKSESKSQAPVPNPIRDIVFLAPMNRFSENDPQPNRRHFIQAFAFSLALHTDGIVRMLLLNPKIPDWEAIGKSGNTGPIASLGSLFGLRLARLAAGQLAEKEEGGARLGDDDTGKRMIADALYVASLMYGQD